VIPIRVLIIDDSVVVRKVLTDLLQSEPGIEVTGTAATASIGIQKIPQVVPDLVLLDIEMPEMDGVEAVKRIRAFWPKLPVIMCSTLTERGASVTLRALANGATDYVAKPSALGGRGDGLMLFRAELIGKVKQLGGAADTATALPLPRNVASPAPSSPVSIFAPRLRTPLSVVAIGCSTGGPNALSTLFADLPGDLEVPILIVQHMPPLFTKMLAERLTATTKVSVVEAKEGDLVEPGRAYLAPGNFHMTLVRDGTRMRVALNQESPENSCRPAVDVMFRSAAQHFGSGTLGVVLTGMGQDGARGAERIVKDGGAVIVQDAASCVVPSMPRAVVDLGMSSGAYPIGRLGTEIVFRVRPPASAQAFTSSARRMEG
jgi:two-component system chemotaxis response regulator CheB